MSAFASPVPGLAGAFLALLSVAAGYASNRQVAETEPNDTFDTADPIQLDDTVLASIRIFRVEDDYFAIDLEAGTYEVEGEFDPPSYFNNALAVYDADGSEIRAVHIPDYYTSTTIRAELYFRAPATGRYYVRAYTRALGTGDSATTRNYRLTVSAADVPGDPTTVTPSGFNAISRAIHGPDGTWYLVASDGSQNGIWRIAAGGGSPAHVSDLAGAIAFDAFGDLIVAGGTGIRRLDPTTGVSETLGVIPDGSGFIDGLVVDAEGTIRVTSTAANPTGGYHGYVHFFDAYGRYLRRTAGRHFVRLATLAPDSSLYFGSAYADGLYRLFPDGGGETLRSLGSYMGIAFDQAGHIYLTPQHDFPWQLSHDFQVVEYPLAVDHLGIVTFDGSFTYTEADFLLWASNPDGTLTDRLVVVRHSGELVELADPATSAPGAVLLPPRQMRITTHSLPEATQGEGYHAQLEAEEAGVWSVADGELPSGLTLEPDGALAGEPAEPGVFVVTFRVDAGDLFGRRMLELVVEEGGPEQPHGEEIEPNDVIGDANLIAAFEPVSGAVDPGTDIDWFSFDVTDDNTVIELAFAVGRSIRATIIGPNGETLADTDNPFFGRVRTDPTGAGRYYARLHRYPDTNWPQPSPELYYDLTVRLYPPGPGEPTTTRASRMNTIMAVAPAPAGAVYLLDTDRDLIGRLEADGSAEVVTHTQASAMALDSYGDLLINAGGRLIRVSTETGEQTLFTLQTGAFNAIAMGPDGDVWSTAFDHLMRFDALGARLQSFPMAGIEKRLHSQATGMAVSPDGIVHVSFDNTIWRLEEDGTFTLAYEGPVGLYGLTFDAAGGLYVSTLEAGIIKLGPAYEVEHLPFAMANLFSSRSTAFLLDENGEPTDRLVAGNQGVHVVNQGPRNALLVEVNPAGTSHPGARLGAELTRLTIENASQHLVRGGILTAADEELLDRRGNGNGRYDLGDLRAYMQTRGFFLGEDVAAEN